MSGFVVAGADGSPAGLDAVVWAAHEAEARGLPLRVVHAVVWPPRTRSAAASRNANEESGREADDAVLNEALMHAKAEAPGIEVSGTVREGAPLDVLLGESHAAEIVVVGARGVNHRTSLLLLGSTAAELAAHAACSVLIVRKTAAPSGPVLVGVDGSPDGQAAVRFAFEEAAARGTHVTALHAWTTWNAPVPPPADSSERYASEPGRLAAEEERLLSEAIAGTCALYPDVEVQRMTVRGPTRTTLIEASANARLTVVGSRGRGGFTGLLLGSVSQSVLHHAHSPVAVVRR